MQAVDRLYSSSDWVTLIFVFALLLLFLLKNRNPSALKGYVMAFFLKGFVEKKTMEKFLFFSSFNLLIFIFSTFIFSFFLLLISNLFFNNIALDFFVFVKLFSGVTLYFSVLFFIEYLIASVFEIQSSLRYFLLGKLSYFYTTSLWLFPALIVSYYSSHNNFFLLTFFLLVFLLSIWHMVTNNKNLIVNKLFYFILYLCALKIAPLFFLFKLLT